MKFNLFGCEAQFQLPDVIAHILDQALKTEVQCDWRINPLPEAMMQILSEDGTAVLQCWQKLKCTLSEDEDKRKTCVQTCNSICESVFSLKTYYTVDED